MPSRLIVGPPGAGTTHRLVALAREAAASGRRVTWVAPPHGRHAAYRRLVADGPLLGVEVVTPPQLLYRTLASARELAPVVTPTLRLALVGEALTALRGALPTPGEARLYARAVTEAKRHGLGPHDVATIADRLERGAAGDAAEVRRLADVFSRYQDALGEHLDYDDVRARALALAREERAGIGGALLVVDGFAELGPLDLALYRALGQHGDVLLGLPEAPPGWPPDEQLAARPSRVHAHRFANPVAETRWVLRAVKRDLAAGVAQADVALIASGAGRAALLALADEFGVPLSDESPRSLAETREGRVLLDLLELPDAPTAARLAAVPELAPLARAALDRRLGGRDAVDALAAACGLEAPWSALVAALEPASDLPAWVARVVDLASAYAATVTVASTQGDSTGEGAEGAAPPVPSAVRDLLWTRGLEAARLGPHAGVRAWWAALVQETSAPGRPRPGVALLDAASASGRRFRRAYLVGAVAGAFAPDEDEDFFVPEDARVDGATIVQAVLTGRPLPAPALPRRHRGRAAAVAASLLTRGDDVVVSAAEADRGGLLRPDPLLVRDAAPAPALPAGSLLELLPADPYAAPLGHVPPRVPGVEELRRSDPCTFRVWAERLVPKDDADLPPTVRLRRALTAGPRLDAAALVRLAADFPDLAPWLKRHREALLALTYGYAPPVPEGAPRARVDAVSRHGDVVEIVRFVTATEDPRAPLDPERRLTEQVAARALLRHPSVGRVHLVAWPLGGERIDLVPSGLTLAADGGRLERAALALDALWRRWRGGPPTPTPGHHCGRCRVRDVCREAPTR